MNPYLKLALTVTLFSALGYASSPEPQQIEKHCEAKAQQEEVRVNPQDNATPETFQRQVRRAMDRWDFIRD